MHMTNYRVLCKGKQQVIDARRIDGTFSRISKGVSMRTMGRRLATVAVAAAAFAAVPLSAVQAAEHPWPSDGYDHWSSWKPWRYVGEYNSAFICKLQGAELVFSGGADDYRCEDYRDSHYLFIK